jgi:hypothetical protein
LSRGGDRARGGLGADKHQVLGSAEKPHVARVGFDDVVKVGEVVGREVEDLLALVGEPWRESGRIAGVLLSRRSVG